MSDVITFNTENNSWQTFPQNDFICSGKGLGQLSRTMMKPKMLEIGCDVGDTAEFMLRSHPMLHLTSIDPYENYVDWNGRPLNEREEVYVSVMERMKHWPDRFELIRMTSDSAVQIFKDEEFDIIFIDGLHTYDQLSKDCDNYYSKLKPGGIFSGHDFTAIEGVNRAAKEFASKVGKEILITECDVWYWIK